VFIRVIRGKKTVAGECRREYMVQNRFEPCPPIYHGGALFNLVAGNFRKFGDEC